MRISLLLVAILLSSAAPAGAVLTKNVTTNDECFLNVQWNQFIQHAQRLANTVASLTTTDRKQTRNEFVDLLIC